MPVNENHREQTNDTAETQASPQEDEDVIVHNDDGDIILSAFFLIWGTVEWPQSTRIVSGRETGRKSQMEVPAEANSTSLLQEIPTQSDGVLNREPSRDYERMCTIYYDK